MIPAEFAAKGVAAEGGDSAAVVARNTAVAAGKRLFISVFLI